jgi:DNA-binding MarR family transcriptional regulator
MSARDLEFLDAKAIERSRQEQARRSQRDDALLAIVNVGLAIEHADYGLTWPATMVLLFVAMAPGSNAALIAKWLRLSPGGVSKIMDQLSIGRMVRGERQRGLGLIERTEYGVVTLTAEGEKFVEQIAGAVEAFGSK